MYKRVLLALDLEGVNKVCGEPYSGVYRECEEWYVGREQAAREINAAAEALFSAGVEKLGLWDNHGGGHNVDPDALDKRIILHWPDTSLPRMSFAAGEYDAICYFGYHCMEGTLGGVLAHTMSSKDIQYYKLNGKYVGEVDMDAAIAASLGMPSLFFCAGDLACKQASRAVPGIVTVATKTELTRNSAVFRDNEELLAEIGRAIVRAVSAERDAIPLTFPCRFEKSFKRVEDAAIYLTRVKNAGILCEHPEDDILGRDGHSVVSVVNNIDEFRICI